MAVKRFLVRWILRLVGGFLALSLLLVALFRFAPVPFTPLMVQRGFEKDAPVRQYKWRSLSQVSRHLPHAIIASEDQLFLVHSGIDYEALQKVRQENKVRKRARGGSTLTQQVAKNLFLLPNRSWVRKGLETYFTLLIDLAWSKRRIAEVYVNIAEWGPGIYGAEAAAQHYFKKPAKDLTLDEAARLAAILPNPRNWPPSRKHPVVASRTQHILKAVGQMRAWGLLPDDLRAGTTVQRATLKKGK